MKSCIRTVLALVLCLVPNLAAAQSIELVDAGGQTVTHYVEGTRIYVRLVDPLSDVPGVRDSVTAQVSSEVGGDFEDLRLDETGLSTGIFTGSIEMRFAPASPYMDAYLQTEIDPLGDVVWVTYEDPVYNYVEATASAVTSRTDLVTGAGTATDAFAAGDAAYVRVEDHRADVSGASDSVTVSLSSTSGDMESLTLAETTPTSGVFTGQIPLGLGYDPPTGSNGILEGMPGDSWWPGDTVDVAYAELQGLGTSSDSAELRYHTIAFVDAAGSPADTFVTGRDVHVRVIDHSNGYFFVDVTSFHAADAESFDVFETFFGSGIWEGSLPLVDAPGFPYNYQVEASPATAGEKLVMDYQGTTLEAGVAVSTSAFVDGGGNVVSWQAMGLPLGLRVTEPAADLDPFAADTVTAVVTSVVDSETVVLTETGASTGVFEATLGSVHDKPVVTQDGSLSVERNETVSMTHQDTNGITSSSSSLFAAAMSVELTDATGQPVEAYLAGDTVYFRLVAPDENYDTSFPEMVGTTLVSSSGDEEWVFLVETGSDTGIFEGSIPSVAGPPSTWDFTLQVTAGDKIHLEYEDWYLENHNYDPGGKVSDVAGVS